MAEKTAPMPEVKKTEKRQLTEVQKLKLLQAHLNQRISQLEADKVTQMKTIVALQAQVQEAKALATNAETEAIYKELGITKGDEIELRNDGTLLINPPPIGTPEKPLIKGTKRNGDRRGPRSMEGSQS
jgi:hypothetical protein